MNRKDIYRIAFVVVVIFFVMTVSGDAQCPMCRMSAETNLQNGGTEGKGLNSGILYMLSLPYLLVASLGYLWYKNKRIIASEIIEEDFSNN